MASLAAPPSLPNLIAANAAEVRARIVRACARVDRDPATVRLIAVTKTHAAAVCLAAFAVGLTDLGENRVQEAEPKVAQVERAGQRPTWHMIGHLQSNKVRAALATFSLIHGVDSISLAQAISRRASAPVPILLEVNVAGEASKFGFAPDALTNAVAQIAQLPHLDLRGLMTIAPHLGDAEQVRPVFRTLNALAAQFGLPERSMGMTDDFEVAIEEGATMVRVGRALFGARPARTSP